MKSNVNHFFSRNSGLDDLLSKSSKPSSRADSDWDMLTDFTPAASKSSSSADYGASSSSYQGYGSSSSSSRTSSSAYGSRDTPATSSASNNGEALKKFGNAKAISSDQFFQDSGSADVNFLNNNSSS